LIMLWVDAFSRHNSLSIEMQPFSLLHLLEHKVGFSPGVCFGN